MSPGIVARDAIEDMHSSRERSSKTHAAWLNLSASDEQGACPRSLIIRSLEIVGLAKKVRLPAPERLAARRV